MIAHHRIALAALLICAGYVSPAAARTYTRFIALAEGAIGSCGALLWPRRRLNEAERHVRVGSNASV